jgi:hypothetical protein
MNQKQIMRFAEGDSGFKKGQWGNGCGGIVGIAQDHHPSLGEDGVRNIGKHWQKAIFSPQGHGVNLSTGQVDAPGMGRITGIHQQSKVPGFRIARGRWAVPSWEPISCSTSVSGSTARPNLRSYQRAAA